MDDLDRAIKAMDVGILCGDILMRILDRELDGSMPTEPFDMASFAMLKNILTDKDLEACDKYGAAILLLADRFICIKRCWEQVQKAAEDD